MEKKFVIPVGITIRSETTDLGEKDARELVRVALQVIYNDGYEDDRVEEFDFAVLRGSEVEPE